MRLPRRSFLQVAAGGAALPAVLRIAWAQDYPTRPVHVVNGFAPGGQIDIFARLLGQWLSERLGQSFVVDSKPGAGTNIAVEDVVNAPPDGYTLLWITTANAINTTLYEKLNFNFLSDIAPVARIDRFPLVMEVNPTFPAQTVPEFIAYAKANPGKINYGSGGVGSIQHVAGELFKFMTGVDLIHVAYRGAVPVLNDLLGGQVQATFSPIASSIGYIRSNKLRVLAVTSAERSEVLPDVPTVGEFVAGYEATAWDGIGAPKGTPADIIDKLNRSYNAALADPATKARLLDFGGIPITMSPGDFGKFIAAETDKWGKVIRADGIKAE